MIREPQVYLEGRERGGSQVYQVDKASQDHLDFLELMEKEESLVSSCMVKLRYIKTKLQKYC